MKLYDLNRSQTPTGRPQVTLGRKSFAAPHLYVVPIYPGAVRVGCFLPASLDSFTPHEIEVGIDTLPSLFGAYEDDPENVLRTIFNWAEPDWAAKPKTTNGASAPGNSISASHLNL